MQQKQILAIVVVAVLAIAACAVVLTKNNDKDNEQPGTYNGESPVLSIVGNADGDEKLDSADIAIIKDVISKNGTTADYPNCDANQDGKITDDDVTCVQNLIDGKSTKANVICLNKSGNTVAVEVNYPLDHVATFTSNINADILMCGGQNHVSAYNSVSYDNLESKLISVDGVVNLGGSSMKFAFDKFIEEDSKTHFGALIIDASRKANITDEQYSALSTAGTPTLIVKTVSMEEQLSTIVTLGYLFGADTYTNAMTVWNVSQPILKTMSDAINSLTDSEKKKVIGVIMGYMLMDKDSENYVNIEEAGAMPLYKIDDTFKNIISTGSSVKINTGENQLTNFDDKIDSLISIRSIDRSADKATADKEIVTQWEKYMKYFNKLDCYNDLVYVNSLLPGVVKVAYMLENLYPDKVSAGFGDEVFQKFVTACPDYLGGCTVDNMITTFDYDDYNALKPASA